MCHLAAEDILCVCVFQIVHMLVDIFDEWILLFNVKVSRNLAQLHHHH